MKPKINSYLRDYTTYYCTENVQKGFFQIILTDKIIDTYVDPGSKSSITNIWFSLLI